MRRAQPVRTRGSAGTSERKEAGVPSDRPWWAVQVHIDESGQVLATSVTTNPGTDSSYTVVPDHGPFDTWEEVLTSIRDRLPLQLALW